MVEKEFVSPQQLLIDSFRLAQKILDSDFRPNYMIALWRGGTPVGCAVQEYLKYNDVQTDHIAVRTCAYEGVDEPCKEVRVYGLQYIIENANSEDKLLIVDDVFDTGLTIEEVIKTLKQKSRRNTPADIRVATVYFKPLKNQTSRVPDFYIYTTDKWIYFPHELECLTKEEIRKYKGVDI